MAARPWQVWIDTGGTFTDCVAVDADGEVRRRKLLSSGRLWARFLRPPTETALVIEPVEGAAPGFFEGFELALGDGECGTVERHVLELETSSGQESGVESAGRAGHMLTVQGLESGATADSRALPEQIRSDVRGVELWNGYEAPILGLHLLFGVPPGAKLPPMDLRLGTTKGTNALLERKGARCAFVVTRGFADLLEIGDQSRPDLFAREIVKPRQFYAAVVEVDERQSADGQVLENFGLGRVSSWRLEESAKAGAPDPQETPLGDLKSVAKSLVARGFESAGVAFLHSFAHPVHEQQAAAVLETAGLATSISSDLSGLAGYLGRAQTVVVDAYLAPLVDRYINAMAQRLENPFLIMTSAGGLVSNRQVCAKDVLLSGPAGGVVGCAEACALAGIEHALAFDMGGTSTDVSRLSGDLEYDQEHQVAGATVVAPALAIRTVAAGGGSICTVKQGRLDVGPESAGADPGPACYGRGGPLTVTDVNLLLGRIDGDRFEVPLDFDAAQSALQAALVQVPGIDREGLLEGFLAIANERMAETIRRISTSRGYDPRHHTLVAFGGAGGQHACDLAGILSIEKILVPLDCSLLSAKGIGAAQLERFVQCQLLMSPDDPEFARRLEQAEVDAKVLVEGELAGRMGANHPTLAVNTTVRLRYQGQDSGIELSAYPLRTLVERFRSRYQQVFGYLVDRSVEVEWSRTRARVPTTDTRPRSNRPTAWDQRARTVAVWDGKRRIPVPLVERCQVPMDRASALHGPALITEPFSSTWLAPGWTVFTETEGLGLVLTLGQGKNL